MPKPPKRPRDMNELAVLVGKIATHEAKEEPPEPVNSSAVKRGKARAAKPQKESGGTVRRD